MAKDRKDEQDPDPVVEWLEAQLELMSARQLGLKFGIDPSVITRNMRNYRKGKGLAGTFRKRIEGILEQERADELHRQHLADQAAAAELEQQQAMIRAMEAQLEDELEEEKKKTRKKAEREARETAAKEKADQERREREQRKAVVNALEAWRGKLQAAGYLAEGEMVAGDAEYLLQAGISKLDYVDIGVAAVALMPADYKFSCGLNADHFRAHVTSEQRLQASAVKKGEARPLFIGIFPTSDVYKEPHPDELWRLGKEDAELIAEWRRLTLEYGYLASGKLPNFVRPETVSGFERLVSIEETTDYDFRDSCLGPDARDRLKRLQRRAVLPAIGLTATEITWNASKSAASWFCSDGWKWLAIAVVALVAIAAVVGVAWGAWEVLKWMWGLLTDLWTWSKANKDFLLLGGLILLIIGQVVWWVWPKRGDTGDKIALRVGVVMLVVLFVGVVVAGVIIAAPAVKEIAAAVKSFDPYHQSIRIP